MLLGGTISLLHFGIQIIVFLAIFVALQIIVLLVIFLLRNKLSFCYWGDGQTRVVPQPLAMVARESPKLLILFWNAAIHAGCY